MSFMINGWYAPTWMAIPIVVFIIAMFGYGVASAIGDILYLLSKRK